MLVLNALSYLLVWILHNSSLNNLGILLVGGFALANALFGMWLTWRLIRDAPVSQRPEK